MPGGWEKAVLPESGFLLDYIAYNEATTDAPILYHLAGGLVCLAVALGNRVYLPFGVHRIYPNLYAAILGASGFSRKGQVPRVCRDLLEHFETVRESS